MTKVEKIKKFVREERTREILEAVGKLGVLVFLGVFAPNAAGQIIKLLGWVPDYKNRYRTIRTLNSLKKKKLIRYWIRNGKGHLELTKEGKMHFAQLKAKKIKLPLGKKWDGLWRMVTFDIPEKSKINRRKFSDTLRFVGMYNLEKSIFVYPHECKEQIFKIAELYEVSKYIRYVIAFSLEPDIKVKAFFPYAKNEMQKT